LEQIRDDNVEGVFGRQTEEDVAVEKAEFLTEEMA